MSWVGVSRVGVRSSWVGVLWVVGCAVRLTYRALRVLEAVASHPGASNRVLGEAAGIADQGQTSRALWRLREAGLIVDAVGAPGRGSARAWRLTEQGQSLRAGSAALRTGASA